MDDDQKFYCSVRFMYVLYILLYFIFLTHERFLHYTDCCIHEAKEKRGNKRIMNQQKTVLVHFLIRYNV